MKRLVLTFAILLGLAAPAWASLEEVGPAHKRGDYETALHELRPLANQGYAGAQNNLGNMYAEGHGVPKDNTKAVRWYRKAAEQGVAKAQWVLGSLYFLGVEVPQNYAEAAKWCRRAANQGHVGAQDILGLMYSKGKGVSQDYVQAHMWYNLAASRLPPGTDRDRAVKNRDIVADKMTPAQIAEAKRMAREWKPKKEGK